MKPDETPFYLTRVECPVCKTINEYETIKMGAYTEEGRDSDFCPTGRKWFNARYQHINPLLYFMATCSSCFYTREFNRSFRDWKDDTTFRTYRQKVVRQRHLSLLADTDGPLRRLGAAVWPASYPVQTAINKFLLGILDERMLEHPSHLDLGRWYLRVAWLFREGTSVGADETSPRQATRSRLHDALKSLLGDLGRAGKRVQEVQGLVESHPESAADSPDDIEGASRCRRALAGVAERAEALTTEVDQLLRSLSCENGPVVGGASEDASESYGDFPSYVAFLDAIKIEWPGLPTCEKEALTFALDHYRRAYEEGRGIEPGNAQIQIAYMVGELARRVGQFSDARQYLNTAMRLGREWIHQMGSDRTKTALARHLVDLAIEQMHRMQASPERAPGA